MTDQDVVESFAEVVGFGNVTRRFPKLYKKDGSPCKDIYTWRATSQGNFRLFVNMVLPYLGNRRKAKALELLDLLNEYELERELHDTKNQK